jgi:hypothetical protein
MSCANAGCLHSTPFTFAAVGLADDFAVPGDLAMSAESRSKSKRNRRTRWNSKIGGLQADIKSP